jgi:hypothetical protein
MAQKVGYLVNETEEVALTLQELAEKLGIPKVAKKDITGDGEFADLVSIVDVDETGSGIHVEGMDERDEEDTQDDDTPVDDADWEEGYPQGTANTVDPDDVATTPEEMLELMPDFEDSVDGLDEFKDFFKDLDTPTAEYIARALGLDWKPTDHENIHRMRVSLAIQHHLFPSQFKPKEKKKKAKYGDLTTKQLFSLASEHKLSVKKTNNEPIDRMRAIMELKKAGVLTE